MGVVVRIKTTSWHYRLIKVVDFQHPDNLCPYCWKVIGAMAFLLFVAVLIAAAAFSVLSIPLHWFFRDLTTLAWITSIVLIAILSFLLKDSITRRRRIDRERKRYEAIQNGTYELDQPREPSLFQEWLRAQHDKVCPNIQFERIRK